MLDKLPTDILFLISSHLELQSICKLKRVNSKMFAKINSIQEYIVTKYISNKKSKTKNEIQIVLSFFFTENLHKVKCYHLEHLSNTLDKTTEFIDLRKNIRQSISTYNISTNNIVNQMYQNLLIYFIDNDTIIGYPNSVELYLFFHFLKLIVHKQYINVDYYIDFIKEFTHHRFDDIFYNYTNYFVKNITIDHTIKFDTLHKLSSYSTSVWILKKLLSYKVLDLKHTVLIPEDDYELSKICIADIVLFKFNHQNDDLISHNYNSIRNILIQNKKLLELMDRYETLLVNRIITIIDPFTNKKIYITGKSYKNLKNKLICPKLNNSLNRIIISKQHHFKKIYFN